MKQVGHEPCVRYVLEGSVRRVDQRVRISAQLIEAETGVHLWAERYDRRLEDIFALQDEVTLSVVGTIEPSLRDAEIARVERKRPDNLDAYDLFLRALPHVYVAMPEQAGRAMPSLEQALALEGDYAAAHGLRDSRAIRLVVNLRRPRCGTELKAGDVGADRCGAVVLVCGACDHNIFTVS